MISVWGAAYEAGWIDELWWDLLDILDTWWPALLIIWGIALLRRRKAINEEENIKDDNLVS